MRGFLTILTLSATLLGLGGLGWSALAMPAPGTARLGTAPDNYSPVDDIACWRGQRDGCPFHFKRGRWRPCVPCMHGPGY